MVFQISTRRYDDIRFTRDGDALGELKAFCPDCHQLITTVEETDSWGSIRATFDAHEQECPARESRPEPEVADVAEWWTVIDYGDDADAMPPLVTPDRPIAERYVEHEGDAEHEVERIRVVTHLPPLRRLWRGEWHVTMAGLHSARLTFSMEFPGLHLIAPGRVVHHGGSYRSGESAHIVIYGWDEDAVRRAGHAEVVRLFATGLR